MTTKFVKIISDGTPAGTRVLDQNGDPIPNVREVVFRAEAGGSRAQVVLDLVNIEAELEGETE